LFDNQTAIPIVKNEVAILIAEVVNVLLFFGTIDICVVVEVKAQFNKFIFVYFSFTRWILFDENSSVSAQDIIDIAHKIVGVTVELIVICRTTLIRAVFFI